MAVNNKNMQSLPQNVLILEQVNTDEIRTVTIEKTGFKPNRSKPSSRLYRGSQSEGRLNREMHFGILKEENRKYCKILKWI